MADSYDIVQIAPKLRSAPGGIFTRVQEVTFTTKPSGITGQVDIDNDTFTPDTVDAAVRPAAANLEAVKHL